MAHDLAGSAEKVGEAGAGAGAAKRNLVKGGGWPPAESRCGQNSPVAPIPPRGYSTLAERCQTYALAGAGCVEKTRDAQRP